MIYVTVGNFRKGFDRLVRKMDLLAPSLGRGMVIQRGASAYVPVNAASFDFVPYAEGEEHIKRAELVVSHAGAGSIILARRYGVPIIIVPRRMKFGEHYTDHQTELCAVIREEGRTNVFVADDPEQLPAAIAQARRAVKEPGQAREGKERLIGALRAFLEGVA